MSFLRQRIREHFGAHAQILTMRRARRFGARLFVVDFARRGRHLRVLGSVDETGYIMEQSAMDLMRPEQLVYHYERMMLVAFGLAGRSETALLLGLGGAAMARHLAAYLPNCRPTIVENESVVRDLARRHFHFRGKVLMRDGRKVVEQSLAAYDVILVDLYDCDGAARLGRDFWKDCKRALKPSGSLAINWAEFVGASRVELELRDIRSVFGRSFFLVERDQRPNIVQLVPTALCQSRSLPGRFARFAAPLALPRASREVLERSEVSSHYPMLD
jgi:spermidine synthase